MKTSIKLLVAIMWASAAMLVFAQTTDTDESVEADIQALEAAVQEEVTAPLDDTDALDEAAAALEEESAVAPLRPAAPPGRVYTLQPHPIFTPDQAESVYLPLVEYLNAVTPHQFELKLARDFHRYWVDIRRGVTPDLVLEDAHVTALRMQRFNYTPLVKASEPATFSLLTSGINIEPSLRDFVGKPVSSMPAPSLGYLVLTSWFDNPMQQPVIQSNASSWLDAVEIVFSMEAEAAIVPHNLVARYVNMEVVETSAEFPHTSISASPDLPDAVRQDIIAALTVLHDDPEHFGALHELDIDSFVQASPDEFDGLERWLEQVFTFF